MSTVKYAVGTETSLTTTALDSLASATYVSAGVITFVSSGKTPLDCFLTVEATPGTVSSFKQVAVFAQVSLDNTDFESGPTSGTTVTDEPNLTPIGVVPCNSNSTLQRRTFRLSDAFGPMPPYARIVIKNETGAALASSGHAVSYMFVDGDVT